MSDEIEMQIAAKGAEQLARSNAIALSAAYSDDSSARSSETETARRLEQQAYGNLAAVDLVTAKRLVDAEREKIVNDKQLAAGLTVSEKSHAAEREKYLVADLDKRLADHDFNFEKSGDPFSEQYAKSVNNSNDLKELAAINSGAAASLWDKHAPKEVERPAFAADAVARAPIVEATAATASVDSVPEPAQPQRNWDNLSAGEKAAAAAIERNWSEITELDNNTLKPAVAREKVREDLESIATIKDENERYFAAVSVGDMANRHDAYRRELEKQSPSVALEAVNALAEDERRSEAKELRKAAEFESMQLDPAALAQVARARAADREAVELQLGLNTIELERARQRDRDDEAIAAAAQVRARDQRLENEEAKMSAGVKAAADNEIVSDTVFHTGEIDPPKVIPNDIEEKYLRVGDKYFHPKNTDAAVFEDKGNKLETRSNSEVVADELVRIAEARGWDEIKVSGTETFRREVWVEAAARGMHVKGYTPSEEDLAALAKRVKEMDVNSVDTRDQSQGGRAHDHATDRERPAVHIASAADEAAEILIAHGAAKYLHKADNKMSYYVTTQDASGEEKTTWGVDLKRAVEESHAAIGDKVIVENMGQRPVTVEVDVKDASGKVVGTEEKTVNRNEWSVKLAEAFRDGDPEQVAKRHPELAGAYTALAAMEKQVDAENFSPDQRDVVMRRVRQNMLNSIERGEVPSVQLRESVTIANEREEERELAR